MKFKKNKKSHFSVCHFSIDNHEDDFNSLFLTFLIKLIKKKIFNESLNFRKMKKLLKSTNNTNHSNSL